MSELGVDTQMVPHTAHTPVVLPPQFQSLPVRCVAAVVLVAAAAAVTACVSSRAYVAVCSRSLHNNFSHIRYVRSCVSLCTQRGGNSNRSCYRRRINTTDRNLKISSSPRSTRRRRRRSSSSNRSSSSTTTSPRPLGDEELNESKAPFAYKESLPLLL
jgi:hypothetical protein